MVKHVPISLCKALGILRNKNKKEGLGGDGKRRGGQRKRRGKIRTQKWGTNDEINKGTLNRLSF